MPAYSFFKELKCYIIFINVGDPEFLKYSLAQAKISNPDSKVYLVGDDSNDKYDFIEHDDINSYFKEAQEFTKGYRHLSSNTYEFELVCFLRWFILRGFMKENGIDKCLLIDSDVMLYGKFFEEYSKFTKYDLTVSHGMGPHCVFISSVDGLDKLCEFMMAHYEDPSLFKSLAQKYEAHSAQGLPGRVCDMTLFDLFRKKYPAKVGEISHIHGDSKYDHDINMPEGFEMEGGVKKITWIGHQPWGRYISSDSLARFPILHFQGKAKNLMAEYFTGKLEYSTERNRWSLKEGENKFSSENSKSHSGEPPEKTSFPEEIKAAECPDSRSLLKSELCHIIPPEIKNDEFYYAIQKLAREENINTVLEIGSSAGEGSTEAFVTGLRVNPNKPILFCIEISKERFVELRRRYAQESFVRCYNVSSISKDKFPKEEEVIQFYNSTKTALNDYPLNRILGWLRQDIEYLEKSGIPDGGIQKIRRENNITVFDMVLIDGSEFTGSAELEEVYGAKYILMDDLNGFKNFNNHQRLKKDPHYALFRENWNVRNGYAIFKRIDALLPVHFFTIVLNGQPFIRHHIEVFLRLPFPWHWHIVEGVADLRRDTAWSLQFGGQITQELHRNGLSNDGTTEYLDEIARKFPQNIHIYRKPINSFWNGKVEMVNAPLANIHEKCLLWQIDADELWTVEQLCTSRNMFIEQPTKTAAYYFCYFFVEENLVITTRDTYGNKTSYEWLRTWHFRPGDRWLCHEPPRLIRENGEGQWVDVATIKPFGHKETESHGLIFQHYAYVTEAQLKFKEHYYGYRDAVQQWQRLQRQTQFPVLLRDYFSWVNDDAQVNAITRQGIRPIAQKNILGEWRFRPFEHPSTEPFSILWVRPDSIGDNVLASSMLPYIRERYPNAKIHVVCQAHIAELYEVCPFVDDIISFDRIRTLQDEEYRNCLVQRLQAVNADLALNSVYSREPLTDLLTIASNAKQKVGLYGNLSRMSADLRDQHNKLYTHLFSSEGENKPELERHKDFLAALGLPMPSLQPVIWITPDDEKFADNFFHKNGLSPERTLTLFAGAQVWVRLYEGYGTALSKICQENAFRVVALGANHEYAINQQNLDQIGSSLKINLCGKTTIRQAAAILKRSRLAVGAETGLAHIACAVGTLNVILLGGGHFGRFMPYSPLTSIVCLPLECFGCDWKCKYQKPHCVLDANPDVIGEAARQTLEERSERPRLFVQPQEGWNPQLGQPQWKMFDRLLNVDSVEKKYVSQIHSKIPPSEKGVSAEKERLKYQMSARQKKDSPESGETLGMVKPQKSRYLVTAIVSTYNSEEFIHECLTDLVNQTIADQLEIIVVDAASPQNERAIIEEFQKKHKNITYIKTGERVGVYAAWNMAIKIACGKYITPFSTNDRLAKNAYQIMAQTLDRNPDVVLVYGDSYVTVTPHETFENHTRVGVMAWPDYSYEDLLQNCRVGPHPMWRKSIHEEIGYFDESLIAIGDQDFWLRIGKKYKLLHIPVFTGLYWATTESLSGNKQVALPEIVEVHKRHRDKRLDQPNSQTIHDSPNSSIIIPTYNNLGFTRECLDAIRQHTRFGGYEIVVVDNGSTDGTAEFLKEEQAAGRLRALFNGHNLGFAKACNAGAKIAQGDYLIFLNNDTKVTSGWLEELIKCAQKDQKAGVVGAKLLYPDDTIQHAGVVFSNAKSVYHIYRSFDKDHPAVNKEREFQAVTAACVLLKKQVFFEAGMFDERYQNGFEDIDLCLKVREKGYKVIYNPRSLVYHFEGKTAGRFDQEKANAKLLGSLWSDRIISDEERYYEEDGLALEVLGKTGRQRAIRLHDSNENPYWTEAGRRRGKGAYKEAVKYYRKALRLNPYDFRNMLIARELGEIYETMGEYAEAEALYRELANSMPSPLPYLQLGRVQRKMRNYGEAIKNLNQALKPMGREACDWEFMYHYKLGMLYKKKKKFDQAIESLEKAKETIRA